MEVHQSWTPVYYIFFACPISLLPIFGIFSKIMVNFEICVPVDRNLAMDLFMMLQEVGKCFLKKESIVIHVIVPRMFLMIPHIPKS